SGRLRPGQLCRPAGDQRMQHRTNGHGPAADRPARPASRFSVLIVERDRLARLGLVQVLSADPHLAVVEAVGRIADAEQLPAALPVDLVLVSAAVPDIDGVAGIPRLLARVRQARVVLLCDDASPALLLDALRAGADGCLPRDITPDGLRRALRAVCRGEAALPRTWVSIVVLALRVGVDATGMMDRLT